MKDVWKVWKETLEIVALGVPEIHLCFYLNENMPIKLIYFQSQNCILFNIIYSLGHAVVVVVAVCVCLLITVLGVGVLRLRAAHRRSSECEAEVEMAWDDTALNITVNPLEVIFI